MNYVIRREDQPNKMLMRLSIGAHPFLHPDEWTTSETRAIRFNKEEAQATLDFITNVIDEYLGEQLYIAFSKYE